MKRIAIIGSSGGNLYNLGGKEPLKLLGEIITQAKSIDIEIEEIVFVGAEASMDNVKDTTKATLFFYENNAIQSSDKTDLQQVNEDAKKRDVLLSNKILEGKVDGLVLMSADPKGINSASIKAAVEKKVPITGTGGTSMANIQSMGGNVIAVSGTTGTTNRTRAISAISSLSKVFGLKYRPIIGKSSISGVQDNGRLRDRISIRGIMMASLPGFISMALVLALSKLPILSGLSSIFDVLIGALPVVVAVIAAKQVSGLDEVGIVAGVIAGTLSVSGGIIGGIIGGILAGIMASYLINKAFEWKVPGTTANIIGGGISGLVAGLFVYYLIGPVALAAGNGIRELIQVCLNYSPALAGLVAGALIWPAIMGGVYHAAILPIVLLEMETKGMSFLGAIDMVGLVMVSAGITLGNIILPRKKDDRSIALPGFLINIFFGTFVEAAYPFMFSNTLVMIGALVSAAFGGLLVGAFYVLGSAYVPTLVGPSLSNNPMGFAISMVAAMIMAMLFTMFANKFTKNRKEKGEK